MHFIDKNISSTAKSEFDSYVIAFSRILDTMAEFQSLLSDNLELLFDETTLLQLLTKYKENIKIYYQKCKQITKICHLSLLSLLQATSTITSYQNHIFLI